ncbi:MAG: radical SAM protein [Treponemataceae bacterium]|nr:radical SAM protein [Treponemataceae bacterium]
MQFIQAKTILSSGGGTGMNVFRGCTHGCIYCDARSKCYHTPEPFENIEVKANAPRLLEETLKRKRKKCMIGTGSMTDPYLHAEAELKITRQCLEICQKYGFGATVHTKSDMVLRDFDILQKINTQTKAVIQTTLTTFDDNLSKLIEPNIAPTSRRFEVLMEAKRANIPTVVWLTPILPFINDSGENLAGILEYCQKAGVKGIICWSMGVTLREGNREYFYKCLDKSFPGLKERYIKTFGSSYEANSPNNAALMQYFKTFCTRHGITSSPEQVFAYLHQFEEKQTQPTLF